jgi:hypothetical protein
MDLLFRSAGRPFFVEGSPHGAEISDYSEDFPPLSPKRNDSKSRTALAYLTSGYRFWVGTTPYISMTEYSLSIQILKSKGQNMPWFSQKVWNRLPGRFL